MSLRERIQMALESEDTNATELCGLLEECANLEAEELDEPDEDDVSEEDQTGLAAHHWQEGYSAGVQDTIRAVDPSYKKTSNPHGSVPEPATLKELLAAKERAKR